MYMFCDFVEEYDPTRADSYRKKTTLDGQECRIDILDTAGQEEYAAIRDNYYRSGEGFICVFSICEHESFLHTQDFHDQICRVLDSDKIPFVLVGNKVDLEHLRKVHKNEAEKKASSWNCPYIEASAKTRFNVEEIYNTILRLIVDHKAKHSDGSKSKKKGKCSLL